MSNLDRFLSSTIPKGLDINTDSISSFIKAYHTVSIKGLKVELMDDLNPG
jgi:hypothetical protein